MSISEVETNAIESDTIANMTVMTDVTDVTNTNEIESVVIVNEQKVDENSDVTCSRDVNTIAETSIPPAGTDERLQETQKIDNVISRKREERDNENSEDSKGVEYREREYWPSHRCKIPFDIRNLTYEEYITKHYEYMRKKKWEEYQFMMNQGPANAMMPNAMMGMPPPHMMPGYFPMNPMMMGPPSMMHQMGGYMPHSGGRGGRGRGRFGGGRY